MEIRPAAPDEEAAVRGVLNAAMLSVDEAALRRGTTLAAVEDGRLLGVLVLDGAEIAAVADGKTGAAGDRRTKVVDGGKTAAKANKKTAPTATEKTEPAAAGEDRR